MHTDLTDDAALATELVRAAAELAQSMREQGLTSHHKTSVSDVVTDADHAAEELLSTTLAQRRPDDGLLGEEGSTRPGRSGRTWVIDPVDGTYNFLHGSSYWCSALALRADPSNAAAGVDADETPDPPVLLGAVYQLATDTVWVGGPGLPTTRNGEPIRVSEATVAAQVSVATYLHPPRMHEQDMVQPWIRAVRRAATQRMLGSGSLDMAAVAGGRLGCYLSHSVPAWDWLPGKALVLGAGGAAGTADVHGWTWHAL
ncbi:MAG: inositol monophosphatase [Micrococcales bacterium]|nr:MAG: inositol monophosphatase [Micrococcales bacterium]